MRYGKRSIWKRIISSPFTLAAVVVLFIVLARSTWNMYQKAHLSDTRLEQANSELAKLAQRQDELSQKVVYLSTEQGIEAEIRTKYHAVKEGESVAVIVDDQRQTQTAAVVQATSTPVVSWWQRVLRFVGL